MRHGQSSTVVTREPRQALGAPPPSPSHSSGYKVGLIARGMDGLEGAKTDVETAGGQGLILQADVADAAAVEQAAECAARELGPIDVWVNAAMVTAFSPFIEMPPEECKRITEVTYLGTVYGTMAALRRMRPRNHDTIVQVGSALAYRAIPLQSAYCGAKNAIHGFTDSLRSELIHDGSKIRLTMVQLPAVNTPRFNWALNRMPKRSRPVPPPSSNPKPSRNPSRVPRMRRRANCGSADHRSWRSWATG